MRKRVRKRKLCRRVVARAISAAKRARDGRRIDKAAKSITEYRLCSVCGSEIFRDVSPGGLPGAWWHTFPGQDLKHNPAPARGLKATWYYLKNN